MGFEPVRKYESIFNTKKPRLAPSRVARARVAPARVAPAVAPARALAPAGGRAFRAWPSPFCHMNELGSGIGLEGVLNTVWVKQIVPLPVDPGKCRLKQQQQSTRPTPASRETRGVSPLDRGAVEGRPL